MILIADAGGTKTEWRLIDGRSITQYRSEGFNGRTANKSQLLDIIPKDLIATAIKSVHFYAAGLASQQVQQSAVDTLASVWSGILIKAYPDTLGAARALYDREPGWVGILGTGSALVYYDGQEITQRIPSLGYKIGDEGSGTALGRNLLKAFLRGHLSAEVNSAFMAQFPDLNEASVLDQAYAKDDAIGLLSQLVPFIVDHQHNPDVYQLIRHSFIDYFDGFRGKTEAVKDLKFTGSVAHYLSNVLRSVAQSKGYNISLIAQSPVAGLTLYHQKHG